MNKLNNKQTPRKSAVATIRKLRKFARENELNSTEVCDMGEFANSTTWKWMHAEPIPNLHWENERKINAFLDSMKEVKVSDASDQLSLALEPQQRTTAVAVGKQAGKTPTLEELTRKLREQEFVLDAYRKGEL